MESRPEGEQMPKRIESHRFKRANMRLVQHDDGILAELRIRQTFPQQYTISNIADHRIVVEFTLKTHMVADDSAHVDVTLFRNTLCD